MAQRSELVELRRMPAPRRARRDFQQTRLILRGDEEGLLAHVGPDLRCGFNRFGSVAAATVSPAHARGSAQGRARHNMSDAKLRSYATRCRISRAKKPGRSIELQGVIVIMGDRQVPYGHHDLQRIDLCAGWHVDTRLSGRGGPNSDTSQH